MSFASSSVSGFVGLTRTAIGEALGTISCGNPSRLEPNRAVNVAAWPIEADDEAYSDRVVPGREDDWNGRSCRFGGARRDGSACSSQHGYAPVNQFRHQRGQSINLIKSLAIFDRDVSALDKTGFTKTAPERRHEMGRIFGRRGPHEPDHRHRRLLRAHRERPSHPRAAERG